MRKIILSIICFLSINVYAETFYTDYALIEENSEKYIEEYEIGELTKIERKIGYNNYEEIRKNENYYELDLAPSNLYSVDLDDYINKNIYAKEPFNITDEQYNTLRIRKYTSANSIALRSFISSGVLRSINVTYDGIPINYTITESNYDFKSQLLSNHMIVLNLGKKYSLDKLNIKLIFEDNTLNSINFMLNVYSGTYYLGCSYVYYDNEVFRTNDTEIYNINFIDSTSFNKMLTNISWIRKNNYENTNSVNYYKKNVNLYKYYILDKNYLNIYTTEPLEGYKLDYNSNKYLYDYYKRDYIIVKDEIKNIDELNNIVLSSSIPLDKITIENKLNEDYLTIIIKANNNIFFKKYPLITNDEIIQPIIQEEAKIEETKIVNDFFDTKEEIIVEKDFNTNNYINTHKPKEILNTFNNNDGTLALLIPEEHKESINNNYKNKSNYVSILIILLIICVKFLTQYLNKKKSFVEVV